MTWLLFLLVFPQFNLFICRSASRIKYPKSYDLPDVEAARRVALKVARVFIEVVPYWIDLSPEQQNDFVVEIDDEGGQTVLTVPFSEANPNRLKGGSIEGSLVRPLN